jgi:hypothetical protein
VGHRGLNEARVRTWMKLYVVLAVCLFAPAFVAWSGADLLKIWPGLFVMIAAGFVTGTLIHVPLSERRHEQLKGMNRALRAEVEKVRAEREQERTIKDCLKIHVDGLAEECEELLKRAADLTMLLGRERIKRQHVLCWARPILAQRRYQVASLRDTTLVKDKRIKELTERSQEAVALTERIAQLSNEHHIRWRREDARNVRPKVPKGVKLKKDKGEKE